MLFRKKTSPIVEQLKIPGTGPLPFLSGTVVETEKGFFYIKGGRRYSVSPRILTSWNFGRLPVVADHSSLQNFKLSGRLGFRDGTIVRMITTQELFVILENVSYKITDPDQLVLAGARVEDAVLVSEDELNIHRKGGALNVNL